MLAASLFLVCMGGGTAIKPDTATVSGSQSGSYDFGRGQYEGTVDGTITGTRAQGYTDQVDIEINGSEGRIRLPSIVLPIIRGGKDGWFDLRGLTVSDRTIEASAGVNFMNRPKVRIDRVTGTISISGSGGTFVGQCQRIHAETKPKF